MLIFDLPQEVLLLFCKYLDISSLCSLARSNSAFTDVAQQVIFRHLILSASGIATNLPIILDTIIRQPGLADHVRTVKVSPKGRRWGFSRPRPGLRHASRELAWHTEVLVSLTDAWGKSKIDAERWRGGLLEGDEDAQTALLLVLLPSVVVLDLVFTSSDRPRDESRPYDLESTYVWQVLRRHTAHDLPDQYRHSLSQVRRLSIHGTRYRFQLFFPLEEALYMTTSFEKLESLRIAHASIKESFDTSATLAVPKALTSLELDSCDLGSSNASLAAILQVLPPLKTLIIKNHIRPVHDSDGRPRLRDELLPDVDTMLDVIHTHQPTLHTFYLGTGDDNAIAEGADPTPSTQGLASFKQLRQVAVLDKCIWRNEGQDVEDVATIFKSWFPSSVEEVRLSHTRDYMDRDLEALSMIMPDIKKSYPSLRLIAIEARETYIEAAQDEIRTLMDQATTQGIEMMAVACPPIDSIYAAQREGKSGGAGAIRVCGYLGTSPTDGA
ncbi:hypothetical protein BDZ85DRAFT_261210 [Elsinoe ampelina]|uniref:F-box domain-containing protein n=1 Tax=Elsinoe ampelina TaxID=302913 RepID=A0A6A6GG31_9PEZI|nr:hypothetical protein BDZ85DRAFT_261210 [Elsinoe ampelina]